MTDWDIHCPICWRSSAGTPCFRKSSIAPKRGLCVPYFWAAICAGTSQHSVIACLSRVRYEPTSMCAVGLMGTEYARLPAHRTGERGRNIYFQSNGSSCESSQVRCRVEPKPANRLCHVACTTGILPLPAPGHGGVMSHGKSFGKQTDCHTGILPSNWSCLA